MRERSSTADALAEPEREPWYPQPGRTPITRHLTPWRGPMPAAVPVQASAAALWDDVTLQLGGGAPAIAQGGFAGGAQALPHRDRIQAAFGHHDVSGVRAHVGGAAAEASQALGAHAYASGDRVAFAREPDLFLAAHEAAHVVQQRGGVQLSDGIGRRGDEHEQHADAVAAAVVRGESAVTLLDRYAGSAGAPRYAVQRFSPDQTPEQRATEARGVLRRLRNMATDEERDHAIDRWSREWTQELLAAISAEDRASPDFADVVARIQGRSMSGDVIWDCFAQIFVGNFPGDVVGTLGARELNGARMRELFTPTQRDKLTRFISTSQIPDRLFNTGEGAGRLNGQQRVMISAHILTTGTYANQQREQQRVEARNCGHFVALVNAYAGMGSENSVDVRGNFDHEGDVVLHGGETNRATHAPGDGNVPIEEYDTIHAGDWLYIKTVTPHSVVFGHWIDTAPRTVEHAGTTYQYRRAVTYDQLHNFIGEGGLRHDNVPLGPQILRSREGAPMTIYAITRIEPPQDGEVAQTPEDLLPTQRHPERVAERNRAGLELSNLTLEHALQWVHDENVTMIAQLDVPRSAGSRESRLAPEQRRLLEETNAREDLEMRVHLNERLQRLVDGVAFLERSENLEDANPYGEDSRAPEDRRAASGYDTSSGRVDGFDIGAESPTTGRLEHVRRPLQGYTAPPDEPARSPRQRGQRRPSRGGAGQ